MLRTCFSLLVLSLMGGLMGCCHSDGFMSSHHVAGVCDYCGEDEAPCTHRAPWANTSAIPIATVPAPSAVPTPSIPTPPPSEK